MLFPATHKDALFQSPHFVLDGCGWHTEFPIGKKQDCYFIFNETIMAPSSSTATAHRAGSSSSASQGPTLQNPIDKAKDAIDKGNISAAVPGLSDSFKADLLAFHNAILALLDSSSSDDREALIEEAQSQHPHFDLNMYNKEAKTALDIAVQHDDQKFARYLLGKGAKPERSSLAPTSEGMRALITSWQRKNLLYAYFNEGNKQSWTPLDRLLHEGQHEEVRARLQGMIAEHGVRKIWEEAMDADRHDVLRALLVVSTPHELRELTWQKELVGKWREALKGDRGLSAVLKEFSSSYSLRMLPAFLSRDTDPAARNKRYVKAAYKELRFFHGTNKVGLESIRANGMSTRLRSERLVESATDIEDISSREAQGARHHNYFIKWKIVAEFYGKNASKTSPHIPPTRAGNTGVPKIVRLFQTSDFPRFEHDPNGPSYVPAYRTSDDIPAHSIRQAKGANRYSEEILTALQEYIENKFRVSLSLNEIEKALVDDGIESDSGDDFW